MLLVKCINADEHSFKLIKGRKYWVDSSEIETNKDGVEYAKVYTSEGKHVCVGKYAMYHFEVVYRYLNYGASLTNYVNSGTGFLLKDIIAWCNKYKALSLSNNLLKYIEDYSLNDPANMDKEYAVNSTPVREFISKGMFEEYKKYMGYSMYCLD